MKRPHDLPHEISSPGQRTFDFREATAHPKRARGDLEKHLQALIGETLAGLVLTKNRRRILSTQADPQQPRKVRLRLHESFVFAQEDLLALVADFALGRLAGEQRHRAIARFREHFEQHQAPIAASLPVRRNLPLRSRGSHFALEEIRDGLVQRYFQGETFLGHGSPPKITWGRRPRPSRRSRPRRRSLRLGSYEAGRHLVRIHPVLDHQDVPRCVVESVVYHELLHAIIAIEPSCQKGESSTGHRGRRRVHTPEFRRRERLFSQHEEAEAWVVRNFNRLLKRRSKGV